ncbi:MAG TPA: class II aldolase/adducin family protein [Bryobacteraceae bacterium]|nr:class II aldolase/adducin family protein [Bryobacteraceae bacterium]
MPQTEQQLRDDIVEIGRRMSEKGWIAASDGNITIRLGENRILATPTGMCKGTLTPGDLIVCNLDGEKLEGQRQPTTEMDMHLTIYRARPDIQAVVHAHPPTATGFAVAGRPLNLGLLPEVILCLGAVPLAEYGLPGTPALVEGMRPYIPKFDAMLLANHGAVAYADNVFKAFFRMDTVEHFARITLAAELLGGARPLARVEIQKLFDARGRYGMNGSRNRYEPGWPLAAEDVPDKAEKIEITREQLVAIIDEALKVRGVY